MGMIGNTPYLGIVNGDNILDGSITPQDLSLYSTGTANGVAYLNGSKVLTTGSALVFDGSNLGLGVTPSAWYSTVKSMQLGAGGSLEARTNDASQFSIGANYYLDASAVQRYIGSNFASRMVQADGKFLWYTAPSGTAGNAITFTQAMTLDASGNLLVGTTTASGKVSITQSAFATGLYVNSASGAGGANIHHRVASTSSQFALFTYVSSDVGSITTNGSSTSYNTSSDYRLKTLVGELTGAGARIDALNPVEFDWNVNGQRDRGFFAHQFQAVYPNSVTGSKDAVDAEGKPVYQAMQAGSSEVIADLVAEIQSLRKRLAAAGIA